MKQAALMTALIVGCVATTTPQPSDEHHARAFVAGQFAFHEQSSEPQPEPEPQTHCEICRGTKRSGDGLGPCPCGDNCQCQRKVEPVPPKETKPIWHLVKVEASWCGPCVQWDAEKWPELKANGFVEGKDLIRVDSDANPAFVREHNIRGLPAFLLMSGGQEVARHEGYMSHRDLKAMIAKVPVGLGVAMSSAVQQQASQPVSMSTSEALDKINDLLAKGRLELQDGVAVTTSGRLRVDIRQSGNKVEVVFLEPQPVAHVKGLVSIVEEIDGITVTGNQAKIHIDKVPEFLEPVIDLR